MTPQEILRALADPERLAVAGALARGPRTAGQVASEFGFPPHRVRRHLARLVGVDLAAVQSDRRTYVFRPETLRRAAQEVGPSRDAGLALGVVYEEEEVVLRAYFREGRLREIPAKHAKRRIVLERLVLEFEPGVRYPERDVNKTLRRFHDDYVSLRRYLVDEELLSRERGVYWRSGGPFDI
jgi:hypothetical protein